MASNHEVEPIPTMEFDTSGITYEDPEASAAIMLDIVKRVIDNRAKHKSYGAIPIDAAPVESGLGFVKVPVGQNSYLHLYSRDWVLVETPHNHQSVLETVTSTGKDWSQVAYNYVPEHPDWVAPEGIYAEPRLRVANTRVELSKRGVHYIATELGTVPLRSIGATVKGPVAGERIELGAVHRVAVQQNTRVRRMGAVVSFVREAAEAPLSHSTTIEGLMDVHKLTEAEAETVLSEREKIQQAIDDGDFPAGSRLGHTTIVYLKPGQIVRQPDFKNLDIEDGLTIRYDDAYDAAMLRIDHALATLESVVHPKA